MGKIIEQEIRNTRARLLATRDKGFNWDYMRATVTGAYQTLSDMVVTAHHAGHLKRKEAHGLLDLLDELTSDIA